MEKVWKSGLRSASNQAAYRAAFFVPATTNDCVVVRADFAEGGLASANRAS